jgi:hypothetical protein
MKRYSVSVLVVSVVFVGVGNASASGFEGVSGDVTGENEPVTVVGRCAGSGFVGVWLLSVLKPSVQTIHCRVRSIEQRLSTTDWHRLSCIFSGGSVNTAGGLIGAGGVVFLYA